MPAKEHIKTKEKTASPRFVNELVNHVEKSWDLTSQAEAVGNELWSSESKAFLDNITLKSLFFSEDWVFIIIDLIASKTSAQELKVMQTVTEGENESHEPMPEHPLNALFEQPNQWQDYSQWMYNTATELFLMGNAIMWHAPQSGQIITLPTEMINMQFDNSGQVGSYVMVSYLEEMGMRELTASATFNPKDICHVRRPNPSSLLWGLSPFLPGRKSVLFNRYSTDYLNAFYLKQATPGLALSLDRTVNEDVAIRQLRSFEVAYQGRKNQRRTLILPKGVSATTLTHSLSDQKLLEHINQNRETICGLLKVPKHEVSLQTAGSLGSEEYRVALRNFWEATLKPGMKFIEGSLTKFFQAELGEGAFLQFDTSEVEALKDDMAKLADTATRMLQAGLSVNEVRQRIWKQEPSEVDGADDPYVLRGSQPVFAPTGFAAQAPEQKLLAPATKITFTPELEAHRTFLTKQMAEEEGRTINSMAQGIVDLLIAMTGAALEVVEESNKFVMSHAMKAMPGKRILKRRIKQAMVSQFENVWQDLAAQTLRKTMDIGYGQMLMTVFNEEDRTTIEALGGEDDDKRMDLLKARGLESFDQVSETHTERIVKEIFSGVAGGESITDIMRRVATVLGTPGQLAGKAETIARTETLTALSIGQASAMDNAKEVIPGLKKVWLTAGDNRVRDSHESLNGDIVEVGEKFANDLRYPRDLNSSDPSEVINCRCSLLLVPPGEDLEIPK